MPSWLMGASAFFSASDGPLTNRDWIGDDGGDAIVDGRHCGNAIGALRGSSRARSGLRAIIGQNSARRQVKLWLQSAQTAPPSDWLISIVYIGRKRKTATEPLRASLAVDTQRRDRKGDKTGNRRFVPLDRRGTRRTHGLDEYLALTGRRHSLFFDL